MERSRSEKCLAFDVLNGLHSGIPLCCVLFFVREQMSIGPFVAKVVTERRGLRWSSFSGVGYVQCDRCYERGYAVQIEFNGVRGERLIEEVIEEARRAVQGTRRD